MSTRAIIILLLIAGFPFLAESQPKLNKGWDTEKIKGARYLPHPSYIGFPFLNDTWDAGYIQFISGEKIDSLNLRYSCFKDEVVYYNESNSAQIVIDKSSLSGFSFTDKSGRTRTFKKLYYDGFMKGERYFEVLSPGQTDLLSFRKVSLISTSPYKDELGKTKNMEYVPDFQFYFYSPEKGFSPVRPSLSGLLSKFDKSGQKAIKKLLRKNRIRITDEENFVRAWKVIEKEGFQIPF